MIRLRSARRRMSGIDKELSADPLLRAIADLFPTPPRETVERQAARARHRRRSRLGALVAGMPPTAPSVALCVLVAVLGLVCCAIAAPLHVAVVASAGAILAACAGLAFVATVIRHQAATTP